MSVWLLVVSSATPTLLAHTQAHVDGESTTWSQLTGPERPCSLRWVSEQPRRKGVPQIVEIRQRRTGNFR